MTFMFLNEILLFPELKVNSMHRALLCILCVMLLTHLL